MSQRVMAVEGVWTNLLAVVGVRGDGERVRGGEGKERFCWRVETMMLSVR